jgi:hypothetical protein
MRGVGGEHPLTGEHSITFDDALLDPGQHPVDIPQNPPSHQPSQNGGDQRHRGERDHRLCQELGERCLLDVPGGDVGRQRRWIGSGWRMNDEHRQPAPEVPAHQQVGQAGQDDARGEDQCGVKDRESTAGGQHGRVR